MSTLTRPQAAKFFAATSEIIWGAHWQKLAAPALGISLSSVVRYAKGDREIPRFVFERLADVVDDVIEDLAARKPALDRAAGPSDAD